MPPLNIAMPDTHARTPSRSCRYRCCTRINVWSRPQARPTTCSSRSGIISGKGDSSSWPVPRRPLAALPQLHSEHTHAQGGGQQGGQAGPQWGVDECKREPAQQPVDPSFLRHSAHLWHMVSTPPPSPTPCASKALPRSRSSSVASTECTRPAATRACLQQQQQPQPQGNRAARGQVDSLPVNCPVALSAHLLFGIP